MASPVPYSPVPDVSPQDRDISPVHVDAPVAAFGGAVAGAITHAGEVAEGAGKELFARAYAMQELNQQDIANKAVADYQNQSTKLWIDYTKNQGQDAIHNFQPFADSLDKLREDMGNKLPSQQAKFLFDQESRNSRARTVFQAGNYAREEMKKFGRESSAARIDAAGDDAARNWQVPKALDQSIARAKTEEGLQAEREGFHPGTPEYDQRVGAATSSVYAKVVREAAKTDPLKAQQLLDDGTKSGKLTATDAANLAGIVKSNVDHAGARNIGTGVMNGSMGDWGAKSLDPGRSLDVLAKAGGAGGYNLQGPEDKNGNGHTLGKYGVPSTELSRWLTDAGMPTMSEEQFLKDPKAQDQLAKAKFGQLQKKYGSFDEAMKTWSSGIDTDGRIAQAHKAIAGSASHTELNDVTERTATKLQPNDPEFVENAKNHTMIESQRKEAFLRQDQFANGNVVSDSLLGISSPNGKLPTTMAELWADPKVKDAYDKLPPKEQAKVQMGILRNIREGGYGPSVAGQAQFEKLYGIGVNPDSTPEERQQLIDTDVANLQMPVAQRQTLQKLRAKVFDGAVANPPVAHAMQVMAPILKSYNIDKASDPDRYNKFVGAFHDALQGYGEGQAKQVKSDDDIKKIGTQLLQRSSADTSWHILSSPNKVFEQPGTEKAKEIVTSTFKQQFGRDPTEEEVGTALLRAQFQLLGKSSGKRTDRVGQ